MKKELKIYLASPRGFCAGVKRAIEIVEKSISKFGAPVYVRHEIVHNKQVVEELKEKGAIFVDELSDIEDAMAEMEKKIVVMDKEFDNNVTIKTDKLDQALNEFMINAFNAANEELKQKMEGNK